MRGTGGRSGHDLGRRDAVPDSLSDYQFAGSSRGSRTELVKAIGSDLQVPASAEIVLEGHIYPDASHVSGFEHALEGPFGDHTGYYNEQDWFPVFTRSTASPCGATPFTTRPTPASRPMSPPCWRWRSMRSSYHSCSASIRSKSPISSCDPKGRSYRLAVVQIKKSYPGHARRIMFGIWSFLRQFMYTKFIIVVDEDVNARDWKEVIWALTTRVDPTRDTLLVDSTPIDYLDFASPVSGLGSKMGLDATNKWPEKPPGNGGVPFK